MDDRRQSHFPQLIQDFLDSILLIFDDGISIAFLITACCGGLDRQGVDVRSGEGLLQQYAEDSALGA
jgi:hypothetical protein